MIALGVITLLLTSFMTVYYAYLSRHTDRDVSFFMGIGISSIVMNLCTNTAGIFGLAWLYFAVALAFIGLGFAVSTSGSIAFYTSIGPWLKAQFSDMKSCAFNALSAAVFLPMRKSRPLGRSSLGASSLDDSGSRTVIAQNKKLPCCKHGSFYLISRYRCRGWDRANAWNRRE